MPELWLLDDGRVLGGGQLFALRLARHVRAQAGAWGVRIVCPAGTELAGAADAAGIARSSLAVPAPWNLPAVLLAGVRLRRLVGSRSDVTVVAGSARCQEVATAARLPGLVHLMHERDSAGRPVVGFLHARGGRVVAVGANAARDYHAEPVRNFLLEEDFASLAIVPPRPGDGTVGVLARLIPEKGVLELIDQLEGLPGWSQLLVAGAEQDPVYARAVHAAAGERVEVLGHVDDVAGFLGRIDVLVVPSVGNEAQPTVILEALAAGRPVVVRRAIGSSDYDGLPVFGYDDDLANALGRALNAGPPDADLLRERFGAGQAAETLAPGLTTGSNRS